ncbi:MAG TPA: DUF2127 domain-containing protein [Thermoanaerobaculia bacterium]|nr:DUF2127 domain-containing protein [Thermoanaerobaculia bacterium]
MKGERSDRILRLIALFRFAKAVLLIAGGFAALRLLDPRMAYVVADWMSRLPYAAQHAFAQQAIATIFRLSPERIEVIAAGAFAYAALFITEGTGLWMRKRWAEWLTVIATLSFIPFEVWEVVRKPWPLAIAVLLLNIAIVIYLLVRLRRVK